MNKLLPSVLLLLCFCAVLSAQDDQHLITDSEGTAILAAPAADRPATPVPIPNLQPARRVQWEYKVSINSGPLQEHELNPFGNDGWELISMVEANNNFTTVFKRQKQ